MGRISAGTGLVSGLNTSSIIQQLIDAESQPVKDLQTRVDSSKKRQTEYLNLSALLLGVQFSSGALSSSTVLKGRTATSSNTGVVTASASSGAPLATYQLRSVRLAQAQQYLSQGFASADGTPLGAGTLSVKLGGFVQSDTKLELLNGGQGVPRGKISITDRSGASATIDLTTALTAGDVVKAINNTGGVRVRASLAGDSFVLTDLTGQAASNLAVQEVGSGSTAASLGLATSVASNTLSGSDVVRLSTSLKLSTLNDGNGVRRGAGGADLRITAKDGTLIDVDLSAASTVQDVLTAINSNSQNGGKVTAAIGPDGDRLTLTDSTGGGGTLGVTALAGSQAAKDLGILGNEQAGGLLTGRRVLAGLNSVLLADLNGGAGITTPGQVQITDRSGAVATVDLSHAESLADAISAINAAGVGVKATINAAGNGLTITDTTGLTTSNLKIADSGGGTTATDLHIVADVAASAVQSGDLNVRYVSENTRLDQLNAGQGISRGAFRITDKAGHTAVIDLTSNTKQTVGDVLTAINTAGIGVAATINAHGDGIVLTDTSGGAGQLNVSDLGGNTAGSLHLAGTGTTQIDGALRFTIDLTATDTLNDLRQKLTASGAPITANIINDGSSSQPFHLLLSSSQSGLAGRVLVDGGTSALSFSAFNDASDAVLQVGAGTTASNGLLFSSATNQFSQVLPGVSLTLSGISGEPVSVTVGSDTQPLVDTLKNFVESFNKASSQLTSDTAFDTTTNTGAVLQADSTTLQIQSQLLNLITGQGGPSTSSVRSFSQLGITIKSGQLSLDENVLHSRLASDPQSVEDFLSSASTGQAKKLETYLKSVTDFATGTLNNRVSGLNDEINDFQDRISFMNGRLDAQKSQLQAQFNALERSLATLQSQQSSLTQLASLATSFASSTSSSSSK